MEKKNCVGNGEVNGIYRKDGDGNIYNFVLGFGYYKKGRYL